MNLIGGILHYAANDKIRATASNNSHRQSQQCVAGVAITGQTPLVAAADITRLILVRLEKPMTGGQPSDRIAAAAAFRAWMLWLLPQLDERPAQLKAALETLPGSHTARLDTTEVLMNWISTQFLEFAVSQKYLSISAMKSFAANASKTFRIIKEHQADIARQLNTPAPEGNLAWYVLRCYQENLINLKKEKQAKANGGNWLDGHGILHVTPKSLVSGIKTLNPLVDVSERSVDKKLATCLVHSESGQKVDE